MLVDFRYRLGKQGITIELKHLVRLLLLCMRYVLSEWLYPSGGVITVRLETVKGVRLMKRMVTTRLTGGMRFEADLATGHTVAMDAAEDVGGKSSAPKPYHLVLTALSGCSGMDVISVLRKKRQNVTRLWIEIDAEQADDFPKVFTKIHVHYHVAGQELDPTAVARAIELSETKYCPVQENLKGRAEILSEFTIHDESPS